MAVAGGGGCFFLRLSVCLSDFPHNISNTDAASITKIDTEMIHDKYWKRKQLFWNQKVTDHKNIACVGLCTFVNTGFF